MLLQAENCPASLKQLAGMLEEQPRELFKFYILFLLGFMSGLAGGQGSRIMGRGFAQSTILGIQMLQHILHRDPIVIYWNYMSSRGRQLDLPTGSPEDMVLVRLASLSRVQDISGFASLRATWHLLSGCDQEFLTRHFLADGINERAHVLEFLPLCLVNAAKNRHVGVTLLLEVLIGLLRNLELIQTLPASAPGTKMYIIDLSDLAEFLVAVNNRFIFQTCISRCKLRYADSRTYLQMTIENWSRTNETDSDATMLAYTMSELLQRQKLLDELMFEHVLPRRMHDGDSDPEVGNEDINIKETF